MAGTILPMISGLHTIWCPVADMDRAIAFYRDVLGLPAGFCSTHWSEFSLPNGKIALHWWHEPITAQAAGWVLGVVTEDLSSLAAKITKAGAKTDGYHETPNGVILSFYDLDGNHINAIQLGSKMADITG